jgi:serine protease Do
MHTPSTERATVTRVPAGRRGRLYLALALAGVLGASGIAGTALTSTSIPALAATGSQAFQYSPIDFADLVEQVEPAVVSITVTRDGQPVEIDPETLPRFPEFPEGSPFREFFERFGRGPDQGDRQGRRGGMRPRQLAQGSGFIVSEDGYVVSNNHVVDGGGDIKIVTADRKTYSAELIGVDPRSDLALLKIESDDKLKFVKFSNKEPRVGDWVVAVGNPFGLGGTVTTGIISGRGRQIGSGPYDDYLQIDAAINRGNSGGPAFNLDGEVIGVNTAIFSPSGGSVGIGFAIPAKIASSVVEDLKDDGKVVRGWLGVRIQQVTEDIADSLDLDRAAGAIVTEVTEGSPAEKAGLTVGDTVLELNGQPVEDPRDLAVKVAGIEPGRKAELVILRNGVRKTQSVEIGTLPGENVAAARTTPPKAERTSLSTLGLTLSPASGGENGVVVADVEPDGPAAVKGIQPGDRILEIAGKSVTSVADVRDRLKEAEGKGRKTVLFLVQSSEGQRFVALQLGNA